MELAEFLTISDSWMSNCKSGTKLIWTIVNHYMHLENMLNHKNNQMEHFKPKYNVYLMKYGNISFQLSLTFKWSQTKTNIDWNLNKLFTYKSIRLRMNSGQKNYYITVKMYFTLFADRLISWILYLIVKFRQREISNISDRFDFRTSNSLINISLKSFLCICNIRMYIV